MVTVNIEYYFVIGNLTSRSYHTYEEVICIKAGYQNELNFIDELNNKEVGQLNPILHDLIMALYPEAKEIDLIKAKKYGRYAKTDIVISIRNKRKGLSLKSGSKNSVHVEPIKKFKKFLMQNKVDKNIIDKFLRYIYSDGSNDNTGKIRLSNADYIEEHEEEIKEINRVFQELKQKAN